MLACSSSAPFHLLFVFFLKLILTVFCVKQCKHTLFTFSKILHCMFYCLISPQVKHFKRVKMSGKALRSRYMHMILAASQLHPLNFSQTAKLHGLLFNRNNYFFCIAVERKVNTLDSEQSEPIMNTMELKTERYNSVDHALWGWHWC